MIADVRSFTRSTGLLTSFLLLALTDEMVIWWSLEMISSGLWRRNYIV